MPPCLTLLLPFGLKCIVFLGQCKGQLKGRKIYLGSQFLGFIHYGKEDMVVTAYRVACSCDKKQEAVKHSGLNAGMTFQAHP